MDPLSALYPGALPEDEDKASTSASDSEWTDDAEEEIPGPDVTHTSGLKTVVPDNGPDFLPAPPAPPLVQPGITIHNNPHINIAIPGSAFENWSPSFPSVTWVPVICLLGLWVFRQLPSVDFMAQFFEWGMSEEDSTATPDAEDPGGAAESTDRQEPESGVGVIWNPGQVPLLGLMMWIYAGCSGRLA